MPQNHPFCAGAQEVAQQQGTTKTMQQLLQSSKRLIKLKFDTQQAVTAVKVQSDEQESIRRQKDERMRQVSLLMNGDNMSPPSVIVSKHISITPASAFTDTPADRYTAQPRLPRQEVMPSTLSLTTSCTFAAFLAGPEGKAVSRGRGSSRSQLHDFRALVWRAEPQRTAGHVQCNRAAAAGMRGCHCQQGQADSR